MSKTHNYKRVHDLESCFKLSHENALEVDKLCNELCEYTTFQEDLILETLKKITYYISNAFDIQTIEVANYVTKFYYLNRGDTYDTTIIYNVLSHRVLIQAWGDLTDVKNGKCI